MTSSSNNISNDEWFIFRILVTIELTTSFKVFQLLNLLFSHSIRRTAQGVSFNDDFLDHLLKQIPNFVIVLVEKHSGSWRVKREQELKMQLFQLVITNVNTSQLSGIILIKAILYCLPCSI